jgi:hypothetical protein
MKKDDMFENLMAKYTELRTELIELQNQFNVKKDEYIKIEGALEALNSLDSEKE